MRLVVGLGNPGKKYMHTRHNAGFMAVDFLRKKLDASKFKLNKKLNAEVSEAKLGREKIILAKPLTFMNNSGESVFKIMSFYKIEPEKLLVFHDDMDLELGILRESKGRGSAGHNGVQSIINILGTNEFVRLRIGIGRSQDIPPEAYVLKKFEASELKTIKKVLQETSV